MKCIVEIQLKRQLDNLLTANCQTDSMPSLNGSFPTIITGTSQKRHIKEQQH